MLKLTTIEEFRCKNQVPFEIFFYNEHFYQDPIFMFYFSALIA